MPQVKFDEPFGFADHSPAVLLPGFTQCSHEEYEVAEMPRDTLFRLKKLSPDPARTIRSLPDRKEKQDED